MSRPKRRYNHERIPEINHNEIRISSRQLESRIREQDNPRDSQQAVGAEKSIRKEKEEVGCKKYSRILLRSWKER